MTGDPFWLSDTQWELIGPLLPTRQRGPKRVSDRIVISGIMHVMRSGCAWRNVPHQYGPYMTVFNRYNRWKQRGIWQRIEMALRNENLAAPAIACGADWSTPRPACVQEVAAQLEAVLCANEGEPKAKLIASLVEWHVNALRAVSARH